MQSQIQQSRIPVNKDANQEMSPETSNFQSIEIAQPPPVLETVPRWLRDRIYERGIPESPLNF
jgi:hypothetical protein